MLHRQFAEQKDLAIAQIENVLADIKKIRTADEAAPVDQIIAELHTALEEIRVFDPMDLSRVESLIEIADRIDHASGEFMLNVRRTANH